MISRRTVLATGGSLVAAGAVAHAAGLDPIALLRRPALVLDLATMQALVGDTFVTDGQALTLTSVDGHGDAPAEPDAFRLTFDGDAPLDLPSDIRLLAHADGDLVLHLGPVGATGTTLEAVVDRSVA